MKHKPVEGNKMAEKTIFVTVGTTQFDLLIEKITEPKVQNVSTD